MSQLQPGIVRERPPVNRSQAYEGAQPLSVLDAATQMFQPLPRPLGHPPYHYDLETVVPGIAAKAAKDGKLVFHVVGDTGGVAHPSSQEAVAAAMKAELKLSDEPVPAFFFHIGDIVYYNGQVNDYYPQFYSPYDHYAPPIIGIPGNHDGDPVDASQTSLDGYVRYFMTPAPRVNPESRDAPRVTLSLPNVYFTLNCPFVTIVGLYSNVPEHGSIDSVQQQWLAHQLATAPDDKALIVAVHHPVYSFDNHHSGSPRMAEVISSAINKSRRIPNLVLTAHVHNYQRIERPVVGHAPTPFIVAGLGGYYHLHSLNTSGALPVTDPATKATVVAANDTNHGFLTLTVDAKSIAGRLTTIDMAGHPGSTNADSFDYSSSKVTLAAGKTVSL